MIDLENPCSICHTDLTNNNLVTFNCNHSIHLSCFSGMLKNANISPRCPLCRFHLCDFVGFGIVEDDDTDSLSSIGNGSDVTSIRSHIPIVRYEKPFFELNFSIENRYKYHCVILTISLILFSLLRKK